MKQKPAIKFNWKKLEKVLVVIDAANLESSVKSLGWWIDYVKLRRLFTASHLIEIRNYCVHHGTDNQNEFFVFLKHHGFTLITKPLKVIKQEDIKKGDIRKANFDVEITMDITSRIDKFGSLVLFSGDSDFDYLVRKLRQEGKKVIVVSTKNHISRELIRGSNKYIDLKKIKSLIMRKGKK
jgi:uncharacterized LabA/DUF88 family protein